MKSSEILENGSAARNSRVSTTPTSTVFPCPLAKNGCWYGGDKTFRLGLNKDKRPYCRKFNRWIHDILTDENAACPMERNEP